MIDCQSCGYFIPLNKYVGKDAVNCPSCKKAIQIFIFPELFRPIVKGNSAESAIEGLDSSCFAHSDKKAKTICDECGSYICDLCEMPKEDKSICVKCFNKEVKVEEKSPFDRVYRRYSSIASQLLIFSVLIWFVSILAAPIALFISLRFRNAEEGFFKGKRKKQKITYAVIASMILTCWVLIPLYFILKEA